MKLLLRTKLFAGSELGNRFWISLMEELQARTESFTFSLVIISSSFSNFSFKFSYSFYL